jgi:hypothetical protein
MESGMDILTELEALVTVCSEEDVSDECIQQWQQLFGYSKEEAMKLLKGHRVDLNRHRISNELWNLVEPTVDARHNKESYEHYLTVQTVGLRSTGNLNSSRSRKSPANSSYLVRLEGPIDAPEMVRKLAGLQQTPPVHATADDSESQGIFVIVDGATRAVIVQKFATRTFQPFFQRYAKAEKVLSIISRYPTLGIDTILPQHRLSGHEVPFPTQDQYPVYFYFYGSLAESDRLMRLLALPNAPVLRKAIVTHGKIKTRAGGYRAMINALPTEFVAGWACKVTSREHEQVLQYYETDKYEVVRCDIHIEDEPPTKGLTFRFICEDELD